MSQPPETPGEPRQLRRPSWVDGVSPLRFLELFEKYRRLVVHHETELPFDPSRRGASPYTIEGLAFQTGWGLDLSLRVFIPVCAALFAFSFYWDFDAGLIRSCSVAGMIGFGTNWVAIKMLFWPRTPRPVFGQGLIPSQRDQLIQKVADEVLKNLINEELIEQKIVESQVVKRFTDGLIEKLRFIVGQDAFREDLEAMILTYVGELTSDASFRERAARRAERSLEEFGGTAFKAWVVKKLKRTWQAPLLELINREVEELPETVRSALSEVDGVLERLPVALESRQEAIDRVLSTMLMGLVREVDVRAIVLEQLSTVTAEELETGFREFSDDKLSFITLLGGLLGLVGGTVIVWPLQSLIVLALLALLMALVDLAVYPLVKSRYEQAPLVPPHAPRPVGPAAAGEPAREPEPDLP
ncbi:MAG: DUF445 family protein [Planctomycetes bacterium]|nr:DUF445 family protein [Planctomycetota bacterium]